MSDHGKNVIVGVAFVFLLLFIFAFGFTIGNAKHPVEFNDYIIYKGRCYKLTNDIGKSE